MFNRKEFQVVFISLGTFAIILVCLVFFIASPGLAFRPPNPTLAPTALIPSGFVDITAIQAVVRSGSSKKFPPIKYVRDGFRVQNLKKGDRLQVIAKWHFWYNVILPDGQQGWLDDEDGILNSLQEIPVAVTVPASPTRPPAEPLIILTSTRKPFSNSLSSCCKICTTGKACGDSCINRNYTCNQPPGCACN